jgi:WD40 repeat protein
MKNHLLDLGRATRNTTFGLLVMLAIGTCRVSTADVFFLDGGNLTAFDGKASRPVFAGPNDTAAKGPYHHLFDWKQAPGVTRFLVSKGRDARFRPDSDAPSGVDLWLRDNSSGEQQIHASVYLARFSPDGQTLAYTTSDCELRIEEREGPRLHTVRGACNPNWKSDGRTVVFEKVPAGRNLHLPETLHLAKLDVATGKVDLLTDGRFDDVRPEFDPSGKWVLFVSGGRSGFASFWKIPPDDGEPEQVTNLGLKRVDESFVPTPYQKTLWSADGRWFVYDFKSGEVRQVWGLEFDVSGKLLRAVKLANGLAPQWLEEGKTFVYLKSASGRDQPAIGKLP